MSFRCSSCGEVHDDLPDLAFDRPAYAYDIPEAERSRRVKLSADLCVVDDEHHFIRGVLEIPIQGREESFGIGVWVSQKKENFETYRDSPESPHIGPFFGWLSNELRFEGEATLNLKAMAHFRDARLRPVIVLEPTDHSLSLAQRNGISLDDAWRFIHGHLG